LDERQFVVAYLDRVIGSEQFREEQDQVIGSIIDLLRSGYSTERVRKKLNLRKNECLFLTEIAKGRLNSKTKFSRWDRVWLDAYSARYSTPEAIGMHRSDQIGRSDVLDVGCGAGMQAIMFARNSHVIGIESDPVRGRLATINSEVYGVNLRIIRSDYAAVQPNGIKEDTVIFSDPLRGSEAVMDMDKLSPSPRTLISRFSSFTGRFVLDLPPRMDPGKTGLKGTFEFLSYNHKHSRLTFFSESFYGVGNRCAILPGGKTYVEGEGSRSRRQTRDRPLYVLVPDESLVRSGIAKTMEWVPETSVIWEDDRRLVLGSQYIIHDFPGEAYEVEGTIAGAEFSKYASKSNFRFIPRFPVGEVHYYRDFPSRPGSETRYLFKDGNDLIIAKKVAVPQ
jgi:SAM-dependent methyltransferase